MTTLIPAGYRTINLGVLPGRASSGARAVNDRGTVVGWSGSATTFAQDRAFIYARGQMTEIAPLPGDTYSQAYGINSSGVVVGASGTTINPPSTYLPKNSFIYTNGALTAVSGFSGTDNFTYAKDINDAGTIVGYWYSGSGIKAYYTYPGGISFYASVSGPTPQFVNAINNQGVAVGSSSGSGRAAIYAPSQYTVEITPLLPGFSGARSTARGINDHNEIVGAFSDDFLYSRAFLYHNGTLTNLGTLPGDETSRAHAINNSATIVGESGAGATARAFVHHGGAMHDLNALANPVAAGFSRLLSASAINNRGWIVGSGTSAVDGLPRAFLLMPSDDFERSILQWKDDHFAGEQTNPSISGDEADPDNDGIYNLMEYATRGDPWAPSPPPLRPDPEGSLTFNYRPTALDLCYVIQESVDLEAWTDVFSLDQNDGTVTEANHVRALINPDTATITLSPTDTKPARFWRLVVHAVP